MLLSLFRSAVARMGMRKHNGPAGSFLSPVARPMGIHRLVGQGQDTESFSPRPAVCLLGMRRVIGPAGEVILAIVDALGMRVIHGWREVFGRLECPRGPVVTTVDMRASSGPDPWEPYSPLSSSSRFFAPEERSLVISSSYRLMVASRPAMFVRRKPILASKSSAVIWPYVT